MKVNTAEGYEDGKTYTVQLTNVYQYADGMYEDRETIQPKLKLEWTGDNGALTRVFGMPLGEDGEPVVRPNLGLSRAIQAHGPSWGDVENGLEITVRDKKAAKAYTDWRQFPRFADHKTEGFQPIAVDVLVNGESIIGHEVNITVALTRDGIANPETIAPLPER